MHSEILVGRQVSNQFIGEVVYIDDHICHTKVAQSRESDLQQGMATDFHQRFRAIVRKRTETRSQSGRQDHRFHLPSFSSSQCRRTTLSPFLERKCLASCSARYTERCWPPVHPNET